MHSGWSDSGTNSSKIYIGWARFATHCHPHSDSVAKVACIVFSSVYLRVCVSVNGMTPEPFEILSWKFCESKTWSNSKARMNTKMAAFLCTAARAGGDSMSLTFCIWFCFNLQIFPDREIVSTRQSFHDSKTTSIFFQANWFFVVVWFYLLFFWVFGRCGNNSRCPSV